VHIAEDCVLGDGCELFPGVVLYRRTLLGQRVRIHGNSVLGSDGFGYVPVDGRHLKIPQSGWVEVGDDVEIGACTTVDRGVLGPTRIQAGTKVDNLCQIAHNVQIGEHCLIVSQTGISGSTSLGDHVTLAGKVGTAGHIHIGSRTTVSGNSMVAKDVPEGSFISGYLARPHRQWMECQAALNRLPGVLKALRLQAGKP
jgi:UDP-3-O-[3-hydroxymyristoyl] glucosamine N-acyltransferase